MAGGKEDHSFQEEKMVLVWIIVILVVVIIIAKTFLSPQKLMLNTMRKEAERTTAEVMRLISPSCNDQSVLFDAVCKILNLDKTKLTDEAKPHFEKWCICIEGVCYLIGTVRLQLSMVLRCIQFTKLIDKYLYSRGVTPCSQEDKIQLYKYLDIYKAYLENPQYFNSL
jgi:hypothetical protein